MGAIKKCSVLLILTFIVFSCGPSDTVSVENFSPTGKVERLTNFVVEFSEDIAPAGIQDKWLDEKFIEFTPDIPGKYKWTSARSLVFSPDVPLEPIQSYKAKISNKVIFNSKYSPDFDTYEFHTPDFDATKVDYFWTNIPHQNYKLTIKANLHFNYAVNPAVIKDYLEVKKAGEIITDFNIITEKESDVML